MSKWERKLGKYAIPNLTMVILGCYVAGYVIQKVLPGLFMMLTLNPYKILQGQVWRLVTWVIAPPTSLTSSMDIFLIMIMLIFYYSLGTNLERAWGTWKYNVYIFRGVLLTVAFSFLVILVDWLLVPGMRGEFAESVFAIGSLQFSTYFINMSIFLAYAMTYSNAQVLLMFVIPVRVKWLGILYVAMLLFEMVEAFMGGFYYWFTVAAIAASLLNFLIFYLEAKHHLTPKQMKRRAQFKSEIRRNPSPAITRHKCAVCGQTEETNPKLEFRFCSKCNGNYEYCQEHLFTHKHVQ